MSFDVIYWKDHDHSNRVMIKENVFTLLGARDVRKMSGDIVVYHGTLQVVDNTLWLWQWERDKERCYAKDMIKRYSSPNASHIHTF